MDPLQAAAPNDCVPIDRDLGVAAKHVRVVQFRGDPLLPGVDNLRLGRRLLDLRHMPRLDGIAEDDSHGRRLSEEATEFVPAVRGPAGLRPHSVLKPVASGV